MTEVEQLQQVELVNGEVTTTSRQVAEVFGKDHAGKFTHKWFYSREGVREIGRFLELED